MESEYNEPQYYGIDNERKLRKLLNWSPEYLKTCSPYFLIYYIDDSIIDGEKRRTIHKSSVERKNFKYFTEEEVYADYPEYLI